MRYLKSSSTKFSVLYLVDGHRCHIGNEVATFCKHNVIILSSSLLNLIDSLKPADVSVFRPVEFSWKKLVSDWLNNTGARTVRRANFAPLVDRALLAANEKVVTNDFKNVVHFLLIVKTLTTVSHESRLIDQPSQFSTKHLLFVEFMFPSSRVHEFR